MRRGACYIRVSTTWQKENSQRAAIKRWLRGNGVKRVRWFVDKQSGDDLDRTAFKELQAGIFNGQFDAVVVYKLDRLSRSLRDGVGLLCDWLDKGVRVVATSQGHDFSGQTGKLIASVLFSVAEMEQSVRRERQAAGIAEAKKRGVYQGRKRGTTKGKPQRAKALRAKQMTLSEIGRSMGVSRRTVARYMSE